MKCKGDPDRESRFPYTLYCGSGDAARYGGSAAEIWPSPSRREETSYGSEDERS